MKMPELKIKLKDSIGTIVRERTKPKSTVFNIGDIARIRFANQILLCNSIVTNYLDIEIVDHYYDCIEECNIYVFRFVVGDGYLYRDREEKILRNMVGII